MKKGLLNRINKRGATLLIVLGISAVIFILLFTGLAVSSYTRNNTFKLRNQEQAYLTSKSALDKVIDNLSTNIDFSDFVANIPCNSIYVSDEQNIDGMGNVIITIKKSSAGELTVIASTEYQSCKSTAAAILTNSESSTPAGVSLFDSATVSLNNSKFNSQYYLTGNALSRNEPIISNSSTLYGNVYSGSDLTLDGDTQIKQGIQNNDFKLEVNGDLTLSNQFSLLVRPNVTDAYINTTGKVTIGSNCKVGSADHKVDIHCTDLSISNQCVLYSDIYIHKTKSDPPIVPDVKIDLICKINGDIYIDGNLELSNASEINGNLYVNGIFRPSDSCKITGNVYCKSLVPAPGNAADISGQIHSETSLEGTVYESKQAWDPATDSGKLVIPESPEIAVPETKFRHYDGQAEDRIDYTQFSNAEVYNDDTIDEINESCIINNWHDSNTVINVKDEPIWIKITTPTIQRSNVVINHDPAYPDTPVFFVVPSDSKLTVDQSTILSNITKEKIDNDETFTISNYANSSAPVTTGHNIYWILEKDSLLNLYNMCMIEGNIYAPKAAVYSNSSQGAKTIKFSTDGVNIEQAYFSIIGSVISRDITFDNVSGLLFLRSETSTVPDNMKCEESSTESDSIIHNIWKIESYIKQ